MINKNLYLYRFKCLILATLLPFLFCAKALAEEDSGNYYAIGDQNLSLSEALLIGLENNNRIRNQQLKLQGAILDFENTNGMYSADYNLNFSLNWNNVDIESEIEESINATANAQTVEFKVIFPWWHKRGLLQQTEQKLLDIELQKSILTSVKKETDMVIYQAYFNLVMLREKLIIAKQHQLTAEARYLSISEQLKIGLSSKRDEISESTNLINHNVNVQESELVLFTAQDKLLELLGSGVENIDLKNTNLTDNLSAKVFNWTGLDIKDALAEKLLQIDLQIERQKIEVTRVNIGWKPRLSARIAYTPRVEGLVSTGSYYENVFSYGVVLQVPFPKFDVDSSSIKIANHNLNELIVKRSQVISSIINRANNLKRQITGQDQKISLLNELVVEQKKEVDSARESFLIGKTSNLELQIIESEMMDSESSLYDALYYYALLKAEIYHLYGREILSAKSQSASDEQ